MNPNEKTELQITDSEKQIKEISEQEYVEQCVKYALDTGWVKPEQKDTLIERYLKPIYTRYREIPVELRILGAEEPEIQKSIKLLNVCLEATRRIGSTDPENILRSIVDLRKMHYAYDTREYAITEILKTIRQVLYS